MHKRFYLKRHKDISGVSGTGLVAEGVQFSDGRCYVRWVTTPSSTGQFDNIKDLIAIHGHEGATEVLFCD